MERSIKLKLFGVAALTSLLASCGGSGTNKGEDPDKTQLYVYSWNGGYGTTWLQNAINLFEEQSKNKSYEAGKTGVQVHIHADKSNTAMGGMTQFDNSRDDVFFTEGVDYYGFTHAQGGNRFLDLTDVVTETSEFDGKTIQSKFNQAEDDFLKLDGKYYAIPHYSGFYGLVYNVDMFNKNKFYLDADGEITAISGKEKGLGPDGVAGTTDDGLPQTYDQFFNLCTYIRAQNIYPIHWTGQYHAQYVGGLMRSLAIDADGADTTMLQSTFDGSYDTAIKVDASGKPSELTLDATGRHAASIGVESATIRDTQGQRQNAYRTLGTYYAAEFVNRLIHSDGEASSFYSQTAFKSTYSHLAAQSDFIRSGTRYATQLDGQQANYAMLVDGPWWESEARDSFADMEKQDASMAREKRNFAWMALPFPTADMVGKKHTLADSIRSYGFAKAKMSDAKKAAAKDFLRFVYSDDQLVAFTRDTGVMRNLNYTMPESTLRQMSPYSQSLARYMSSADLLFPYVNSTFFRSNQTRLLDGARFYQCTIQGNSRNAVDAFRVLSDLTTSDWFTAFYNSKQDE